MPISVQPRADHPSLPILILFGLGFAVTSAASAQPGDPPPGESEPVPAEPESTPTEGEPGAEPPESAPAAEAGSEITAALERALERIEALESRVSAQAESLDDMDRRQARADSAQRDRREEPEGTPALHHYGDVSFRAEYIGNERWAETDAVDADDHRVLFRGRIRLGATYAEDFYTIGFRFASGSQGFPSTAFHTYNDDLRRWSYDLDRAFIQLAFDPLTLWFGKFQNPWVRPTELLWDNDVQPTGLAQRLAVGDTGLSLVLGQYVMSEFRTRNGTDPTFVFQAQAIYDRSFDGFGRLTVAAGGVFYTNPSNLAESIMAGDLDGAFRTNRIIGEDTTGDGVDDRFSYFSDYHILTGSMDLRIDAIDGLPIRAAVEVTYNLGAGADPSMGTPYDSSLGFGFGGMVWLGKAASEWDFRAGVGGFRIEADSAIAVFTSDDLQSTNVNTLFIDIRLRFPLNIDLVWDTYLQQRINKGVPAYGNFVHGEDALRFRSRLTVVGRW